MAYERYGTRDPSRDDQARWRDDRGEQRGGREERGFFERAGDEVASWFGDEEAERRRREDMRMSERERGRRPGRDWRGEEYSGGNFGRSREEDRSSRWTGRDFDHEHERGHWQTNRERDYRPMAGDYSRGSEQFFAASGVGREGFDRGRGSREREDFDRGRSWREREPDRGERSRSFSEGGREYDPHYRSWRERHMSDLDRDYAEYRREEQARFERDFGSWRERRMQKRRLLDDIREHMEVVGSDDQHVGTIDRVAGDRIVLTRSDPDSGGMHHSLSCAEIDRIEGDRVILDLPAEQAKQRWRDEARERALFEREDQGEMGPRALGRSFEGTYR